MSATGLDVFDKTLQTTHIWLDELMQEIGPDRQVAWHVLGAVLRGVRDRIPLDLAAHLGAQLPLLVRGTCRVGGGRAFALLPSARSNGSCGFPASRFPVWSSPLTGDDPDPRHQMDQPDQSELVHQTSGWIASPRRVPPSPRDEGEQAPLDPAVETVEQG